MKIFDDNSKQWIECVWHHHEDGKHMIPVPVEVHNRADGGASHTGGASVINKDLVGFFLDLKF